MGAPQFDLDHLFTYHVPTPVQQASYVHIRDAAKSFAATVLGNTPAGADQSAAIRLIREAVMTANAAIALEGRLHVETPPVGSSS